MDPLGRKWLFSLTLSRWERETICRHFANPQRLRNSRRGLGGSLSQRARAGVRENDRNQSEALVAHREAYPTRHAHTSIAFPGSGW